MGIEIRFVGGPADGRSVGFSGEEPPWVYRVPLPPSLSELLASPMDFRPAPIPVVEYEQLREGSWPRRADDGAYLYQHRPAPVSPDERRRLARARREARAAKARREAELDAAWRAIREERPHFPEDRRDAF